MTISASNSDNFNYHKPKFYKTLKCLNIHFDNKTKIETKEYKDHLEINLFNEDHTIGNLLTDYFNKLKIKDLLNTDNFPNTLEKNKNMLCCEYVSYKVVHPLEEILLFQCKLNKDIIDSCDDIFSYYNMNVCTISKLYIFLFAKTINKVIEDINILQKLSISAQEEQVESKKLHKNNIITEPSFIVNEVDYNPIKLFD